MKRGAQMAYNELIKNFGRIRDYMRDFYVYGFKSRSDFDIKSGRSYDNERRRIESYLGDYMSFRQTSSGKTVFISIDSRNTEHNPLTQLMTLMRGGTAHNGHFEAGINPLAKTKKALNQYKGKCLYLFIQS